MRGPRAAASAEHPRARGENKRTVICLRCRNGTSPRTRGKPGANRFHPVRTRNIPAHAGKTAHLLLRRKSWQEHPRARGENVMPIPQGAGVIGTSPRTRGKLPLLGGKVQRLRNIPAHAGKTDSTSEASILLTEHPRARGENVRSIPNRVYSCGTSPRTRGKRIGGTDSVPNRRNIPAHAGKTRLKENTMTTFAEHPRARGENGQRMRYYPLCAGTSPRTRGKHNRRTRCVQLVRNIPAHAGKTESQPSGK